MRQKKITVICFGSVPGAKHLVASSAEDSYSYMTLFSGLRAAVVVSATANRVAADTSTSSNSSAQWEGDTPSNYQEASVGGNSGDGNTC